MNILTHWSEKDWTKFTKWLKDMLKIGTATVTFTKKDGTDRVMKCTLNPDSIPTLPTPVTENKKERKVNTDVLAVYDIESQGWRSFTIKSVKKVEFII